MINELTVADTFSEWMEKLNDLVASHNADSQTLEQHLIDVGDVTAFTYNKSASSGLVVHVYGGRVRSGSLVETIADTVITLPASSVRVLAIYKVDGVAPSLKLYTPDTVPEKYIIPIAIFTTSPTALVQYTDLRTEFNTSSGSASASSGVLQFDKIIDINVSVPAHKNALSISPTVAEGVSVTVGEGSVWVVL